MKLTIELLSDLCTYSGDTYNSMVDTDVVYDEHGIPYIPAKRIKGCIREAAMEMADLWIGTDKVIEIFGKEGNQNSAFSLSNAYIENHDQVVEALEKCSCTGLKSPQNVLNRYTYMRIQTAINSETGVAKDTSLRRIRVVKKGLTFVADCNWIKEVSAPEILGQAVSLVKHMGMTRTRGLGLVKMELSEADKNEEKIPHVLFSGNELGDQNKIHYTIRLKSALICKSAQGNQAVTEDYIAGSKVLGLLAGALKPEGYEKLVSSGEVIVSNAYIAIGKERCGPGRISLQKVKDQRYDTNGEMKIKDMLLADPSEIKGKQMSPANISYMAAGGTVADVETEISYHHQRPSDKSVGRATGLDGSSFYQLAAISPNQSFMGYIYANKEQAQQIIQAVESMGEVRMGYGRSSEFGTVEFTLDSVEEEKEVHKTVKEAILTLGSDVLLYNEKGMLTTDIHALEEELREMTGTKDLCLVKPYIQFNPIGGYNVTWQCRKPAAYALAKGSTFLLCSDQGFDMGLLNGKFAGERVAEGYGELLVKEPADTSDVVVKKIQTEKTVKLLSEDGAGILQELLQDEFEKQIKTAVRKEFEENESEYENKTDSMGAAVAKLRILFKTEKSYEAMQKEVEGIEMESKNSLCKSLIERIEPDKIGSSVQEQMKKEYGNIFTNELSKEQIFQKVYNAYLSELKYFTKTHQKKGDKNQ